MSSFKDVARAAITNELNNAPEMAIINDFKAFILTKIAEPAIDLRFIYVYPTRLQEHRLPIMNLCAQIGLNNIPVHITLFAITVETKDILQE